MEGTFDPEQGLEAVEAALLRPLTTEERTYVPSSLKRAARLILREVKPFSEWDDEYYATVRDVQAEMVARRFRNVEGFTSEGDGTYNYRIDQSVASGKIQLTDDDRRELGLETDSGWGFFNPQYGPAS